MEIRLSQQAMPESIPLPVFESVEVGTAENNGESFVIYLGLNTDMVEKLKKLSLDTSDTTLQEHTSDFKRFGEGSYGEWYAKSRVPFALVHKNSGALAALVWFGPKPLGRKSMKHLSPDQIQEEKNIDSGNYHCATYRSYIPIRGTGIMKEFLRAATDIYLQYFPGAILWTGISRTNPGSIALSGKLGYEIDEAVSDPTWVAMVKR
jgi:hypothetical protein